MLVHMKDHSWLVLSCLDSFSYYKLIEPEKLRIKVALSDWILLKWLIVV